VNTPVLSLVIDCLAAGFREDVDIFVIFAGDGGYAPLVNFLIDELKKEVYVYSVKGSTQEKVYQRLKDHHLFINDTISHTFIDFTACDFDPNVLFLVNVLNEGIIKTTVVPRRTFIQYIQQNPKFKNTEINCGELLDKAIQLRLVIPYTKENQNGTGHLVRALSINYDHPEIKKMGITPKR